MEAVELEPDYSEEVVLPEVRLWRTVVAFAVLDAQAYATSGIGYWYTEADGLEAYVMIATNSRRWRCLCMWAQLNARELREAVLSRIRLVEGGGEQPLRLVRGVSK